ncbi:unnamed protein product [Nesidiocoris tenuis]|uniref:Uncharacterized protein n=1 Tax=Nesidiocoris tenuis TaxID=355587 RepID=A0A6H5FZG5_9HEMI|nr:unnamed protein product [Nesidiocoris tenuis]
MVDAAEQSKRRLPDRNEKGSPSTRFAHLPAGFILAELRRKSDENFRKKNCVHIFDFGVQLWCFFDFEGTVSNQNFGRTLQVKKFEKIHPFFHLRSWEGIIGRNISCRECSFCSSCWSTPSNMFAILLKTVPSDEKCTIKPSH